MAEGWDAAAHCGGRAVRKSRRVKRRRDWFTTGLDWDWRESEAAYKKALSLDPSHAHAYGMLGVLLGTAGRHAEARAAMRRARELDPLHPLNHALSAHVALLARDYSAGVEFARRATVVGPAFWIGYFQLAWAHERLGNMELALEAVKDAETFSSGNSKTISLRGYILATSGRRDEAAGVLSTLEAMARDRYVPPYAFASYTLALGPRRRWRGSNAHTRCGTSI